MMGKGHFGGWLTALWNFAEQLLRNGRLRNGSDVRRLQGDLKLVGIGP